MMNGSAKEFTELIDCSRPVSFVASDTRMNINMQVIEFGLLKMLGGAAEKDVTQELGLEVLRKNVTLINSIIKLQATNPPSVAKDFLDAASWLVTALDPDDSTTPDDQDAAWRKLEEPATKDGSLGFFISGACFMGVKAMCKSVIAAKEKKLAKNNALESLARLVDSLQQKGLAVQREDCTALNKLLADYLQGLGSKDELTEAEMNAFDGAPCHKSKYLFENMGRSSVI